MGKLLHFIRVLLIYCLSICPYASLASIRRLVANVAWKPDKEEEPDRKALQLESSSLSGRSEPCQVVPSPPLDPPETLRWLYGDAFVDSTQAELKNGTIAVLGLHHAGTSMTTRLLMLLGAYGGRKEALEISAHNPLKFYELTQLFKHHNSVLGSVSSPNYKAYQAVDMDLRLMDAGALREFECMVLGVMAEIGVRRPCVMKDPRMPLLMPLWRPLARAYAPDLVCLLVYKSPVQNAIRLSSRYRMNHMQGSSERMFNATGWLSVWESSMLRALGGCQGTPTMVADATSSSDVHEVIQGLHAGLSRLGVRGLRMPSDEEIQDKVIRYFDESTSRGLRTAEDYSAADYDSEDKDAESESPAIMSLSQERLEYAILWGLRNQEHLAPGDLAEAILNLATVR